LFDNHSISKSEEGCHPVADLRASREVAQSCGSGSPPIDLKRNLVILGDEVQDLHLVVRNKREGALGGYAKKFSITMLPFGRLWAWQLDPLSVRCIASFDPLGYSFLIEEVNAPSSGGLVLLKCDNDLYSWKMLMYYN